MENIKVSVNCLVYNHEKYLRKCLDGFVMQKTNFKFEVLIHDDASTDGSVMIIREYEKKYPDIIKPIYQAENQYSKHVGISRIFQYPRAKGKYIAFCEGDDFWCDENKLQMQYDAMESNPEAVFCACKVQCVNESGFNTNEYYPRTDIKPGRLTPKQMMLLMAEQNSYPFQTSGYFIKKNVCLDMISDAPKFVQASNVGDVPLMLYSLTKGDFIYIDKIMSCYRTLSLGSWNSRNNDELSKIKQVKNSIASYILFDIYSNFEYTNQVEKMILCDEFYINQLNNNYKEICKKKYREFFAGLSLNQKLYYRLASIFPFFEKTYTKVIKYKNEK